MTEAVEQFKSQLKHLSLHERAEIAHFLLASLEPEDEGAAEAWETEVTRRVADIRHGRATGRPAEEVFAELRKQQP